MNVIIAKYDHNNNQGNITTHSVDDEFILFMLKIKANRHGDSAYNTLSYEIMEELVHGSAMAWQQDTGVFFAIGKDKQSIIKALEQTARTYSLEPEEIDQMKTTLGVTLSPDQKQHLRRLGGVDQQ